MIDRYGELGQATSLRQMMDRLFEDAVVMPWSDKTSQWGGPALDVFEQDDNLIVEAHLPGVKAEDIDVQVEQGVLKIAGTTQSEKETKDRHYLVREQRAGRFLRTLQMPASITDDPSEAVYQNGVLRLVFPKTEAARPRRIPLSAEGKAVIPSQASFGSAHQTGGQEAGVNGASEKEPVRAG